MNKILLVEDDYNLGLMIRELLELNGYGVTLLRKGSKTIEHLLEDRFELILLDRSLNGMDGSDICAEIRKTGAISVTPILMMSALDGARENCIAAGANGFLAKPFEIRGLLTRVRDITDK